MTNLLIDAASNPHAILLFAHGAGAPMDSPFMTAMATRLAARGVTVVRFEFPYMSKRRTEGGKRPPDRMPALLSAFHNTMVTARDRWPHLPLFIGGKSMGGRVAAMIATEIPPTGVICLGYPFHAAGKPTTAERLAPLLAPCCPVLIVQGDRDALGNAETIASLALSPLVQVRWIPDGDHSLKPRKTSGLSAEDALTAAAEAISTFMAGVTK
ncbi:MAG: alpha/beta hydrolase [Rhodospirillaceae bacterium]|nr:alpha/beta hydrolase [Rhodospirillaceae bacterium]